MTSHKSTKSPKRRVSSPSEQLRSSKKNTVAKRNPKRQTRRSGHGRPYVVEEEAGENSITNEITDSLASLQAYILRTTVTSISDSHDSLCASLSALRGRLARRAERAAALLRDGAPFAPFGEELLEFVEGRGGSAKAGTDAGEHSDQTDVPNTSDPSVLSVNGGEGHRIEEAKGGASSARGNNKKVEEDAPGKTDGREHGEPEQMVTRSKAHRARAQSQTHDGARKSDGPDKPDKAQLPGKTTARLKDRMHRLAAGTARHERKVARLVAEWQACEAALADGAATLEGDMAREADAVAAMERTAMDLLADVDGVVTAAVEGYQDMEKQRRHA